MHHPSIHLCTFVFNSLGIEFTIVLLPGRKKCVIIRTYQIDIRVSSCINQSVYLIGTCPIKLSTKTILLNYAKEAVASYATTVSSATCKSTLSFYRCQGKQAIFTFYRDVVPPQIILKSGGFYITIQYMNWRTNRIQNWFLV